MSSSPPASPEPTTSSAARSGRSWGVTLLWIAPLLFMLVVLVYGLMTRQAANPGDGLPRIGQPLADFTLSDLHGRRVQLSALRGKVVFINVWATWCQPCIDEMPTIQRLYDLLQARGLEVLAVSLDPLGEQVVAPFMRNYQLTFPVLLDPGSSVERLYGTTGVPESFIVDKRGVLVEKVVGPRDWSHPQMLAMFERLLALPHTQPQTRG
jgi:peroxiredoxin